MTAFKQGAAKQGEMLCKAEQGGAMKGGAYASAQLGKAMAYTG